MRICELHNKSVVNVRDGSILGNVVDINCNLSNGCIYDIIVPGPPKFCGLLGRDTEYVIPLKCITNIGADVILVDVCVADVTVSVTAKTAFRPPV